jgi:hypothetical protein
MADPQPLSDDGFDALLDNLKKSANGDGAAVVLELEKLRQEREDKRAERAEQQRREERAEAKQAEMNKLLLGLAASLLPSLLNKGTDPALLALIGSKGNNLDEVKAIIDLQRSAAVQQAEMMQRSFLEILKTKEEFHQQMLTKAIESAGEGGGEEVGGFAGTLREVRLALGALAPNGLGAPTTPAPAIAAPASDASAPNEAPKGPNPPPAQPAAAKRAAPCATVLHQLKALQEGAMKAKPAVMRAALVTVTLQDDKLVDALMSEDGEQLMAYCQPFVLEDAVLLEWIQKPGVAEWLTDYIERILVPLVEAALDEGDEDDGDETSEPETLGPQHVNIPPRQNTMSATVTTNGAGAAAANKPAPAGAKG